MLFAALCGSQVWNSLTPLPDIPAAASATAAELCGCVLASSSGASKSVCSSLLELCPKSEPRSVTLTRSERGGARSGVRGGFAESGLSEEDGGDEGGAPFCCAHTMLHNPKNRPNRIQHLIALILPL